MVLYGLCAKIVLNIVLIQIPEIGVNGAAIASSINNILVFLISYIILKKTIKLNLKPRKFIVKPLIATIIMSVCSYTLYMVLNRSFTIRKNCNNNFFIICSWYICYICYST
ncbi:MAG: hypothetical protein HFJ24_01865 [Clostridia bacterium]|nr:hypothetical protein [Clostridia bacterium]MCI9274798.1 hypothetical protein [Clostridia bacterium]